jgi:nucleoside-diphosphate-sugar epimerase
LLELGHSVRVFDNFSSGKRENLKGLDVEIIEGDLRDADAVAKAVQGMEIIFHEAAFVSVPESMEKPQECFDVNVTGTSILFEAARKAGVKRAVFASSAAVYGDSEAYPLSEDTPLRQLSPYATSKRVDELYGQLYTSSFNFEVVACAISTSTVRASDQIRCMPPLCRSSSAASWITNPSPFLAMAVRAVTWSTCAMWCKPTARRRTSRRAGADIQRLHRC